jgi:hypothetical protein
VQQILLGMVGQRLRHLIGAAVRPIDDIEPQKGTGFALERSRHGGGLGGIAVDVKCRRIIAVAR